MDKILITYKAFLETAEQRYRKAIAKHALRCKPGCHECCSTGLFDITLLDALHLHEAVKRLSASAGRRIIDTANAQLDLLEEKKLFYRRNPLLTSVPDILALSLATAGMSCPALDGTGRCLLYAIRPHICRVMGPTVRGYRRKVWLKGCRHFTRDIPEEDVRMADQYVEEIAIKQALFTKAGHERIRDIDTIMPAAIALDLRKWL